MVQLYFRYYDFFHNSYKPFDQGELSCYFYKHHQILTAMKQGLAPAHRTGHRTSQDNSHSNPVDIHNYYN